MKKIHCILRKRLIHTTKHLFQYKTGDGLLIILLLPPKRKKIDRL